MKPFYRLLTLALGAAMLAPYVPAGAAEAPQKPPRPYGRGEASYHATATAPYTFENEIIKVSFDFAKGVVSGQTTNIIHPKADGLQSIPFDSVGLQYSSVTVNGATAVYHTDGNKLVVDLAQPAKAGDRLEIVATYTTTPVRGIYFIRPDSKYPNMQPEIWSQGETEDNRRWFPTWDEPNEKSPSELIVTVQKGWTVIANGSLKSQSDSADASTTTFDWVEVHPHSSYLTAFSAGPYTAFHTATTRPDGTEIPVDYFTSAEDAKYATLCFGRTKDIVAFFQQIIGVTYPWEKYDQTTVERFTAGGMENASATTQTELAIHPPSWDLVRPCDGLVAHELAHQWWGDDVTTPDWANIWINEGYATYFEELWAQHHFGEARFEYERYDAQQSYFSETKRYWRPIVDYVYASAFDSFDASGYPRPGQVLHMLRWMYGDKRFFGALRDYLNEYQYKTANTHQFFAAISKSLGENLDWFEQEWFYRAAYPHFYVTQSYDASTKTLSLDVTQKNHDGKPFRMPIDVAVYVNGHGTLYRFTADRNHQVIPLPHVAAMPEMVLFDPNNNVLRELNYKKSVNQLGYQLLHAPSVSDRLWAAEQLDQGQGVERRPATGDAVPPRCGHQRSLLRRARRRVGPSGRLRRRVDRSRSDEGLRPSRADRRARNGEITRPSGKSATRCRDPLAAFGAEPAARERRVRGVRSDEEQGCVCRAYGRSLEAVVPPSDCDGRDPGIREPRRRARNPGRQTVGGVRRGRGGAAVRHRGAC